MTATKEIVEDIIYTILDEIVTEPDQLSLDTDDQADCLSVLIKPAQVDVGLVYGKNRKTYDALCHIMCCLSARFHQKIKIQVVKPCP